MRYRQVAQCSTPSGRLSVSLDIFQPNVLHLGICACLSVHSVAKDRLIARSDPLSFSPLPAFKSLKEKSVTLLRRIISGFEEDQGGRGNYKYMYSAFALLFRRHAETRRTTVCLATLGEQNPYHMQASQSLHGRRTKCLYRMAASSAEEKHGSRSLTQKKKNIKAESGNILANLYGLAQTSVYLVQFKQAQEEQHINYNSQADPSISGTLGHEHTVNPGHQHNNMR